MNPKRSLRSMLTVGFAAIALPLVCLLLYSNHTASDALRGQAAEANKNMITLYANQIQAVLGNESKYLYDLASYNSDILSLDGLIDDSTEYTLAKVRIRNSLQQYIRFNSGVDIQFAYHAAYRDLIATNYNTGSYEETAAIASCLNRMLASVKPGDPSFSGWKELRCGDVDSLVRLVDTGYGVYLGGWARLDHLMVPLELIQLGGGGFAAFADRQGRLISGTFDAERLEDVPVVDSRQDYQRIRGTHETYIAVSNPVATTDVGLAAFIPEERMLQNLSWFRKFIAWLPFFAVALLLLYLLYLNNIIIKPMNGLLKGMRTLTRGDWKIRLGNTGSREFNALNDAFNGMANEIQDLKIHVYEEQIRTHKAELKHLQLQINPHFLLNSINVVYNLAQLKNYEIIQSMCLNLVKYFRFTTQTNQPFVTLSEELDHMDSYLRIQQLRFPGRITFRIGLEEEAREVRLPPLIVQPFIENAIKYGFDFMEEPFHIEIQAMLAEGGRRCLIRIADNGCGFPEDVLNAMQNGDYFRRSDGNHLGIWNCYHRLQLLYGPEAKLSCGNAAEGGALIELTVPAQLSDSSASLLHA
ncbi:histidine kinase [Cohnella sp. GCM10020058]|uniref:sensor histidine kinase n=1 Tax=Cohnella sp. GCM10020058 TaxID=3317330 RepID=UPI003638F788